jgi:hypothetical protein
MSADEEGSDSVQSDERRVRVAETLREWIDSNDPENRHILDELESDIRDNNVERLNLWGQFALEDLMRPPRNERRESPLYRVVRWLEIGRSILLFVPVAFTWYSIEQAAKVLESDATNDKGALPETFLDAWLNFSTPSLTLTAFIDLLLIVGLIVLTLSITVAEEQAESQAIQRDRASEREFRYVLKEVGLFLHGFRSITPSALKSGLAEAVQNLRKATDDLRVVAQTASVTLDRFAVVSATQLEPALQKTDWLINSLGGAATSHQHMADLVRAMQANLDQTVGSLDRSFGAVAGRVDTMGERLEKSLENHVDQMVKAMRGLYQELQSISDNIRGAMAASEAVAEKYRDQLRRQ